MADVMLTLFVLAVPVALYWLALRWMMRRHERELATIRDRFDAEVAAIKAQWDADCAAIRDRHEAQVRAITAAAAAAAGAPTPLEHVVAGQYVPGDDLRWLAFELYLHEHGHCWSRQIPTAEMMNTVVDWWNGSSRVEEVEG